MFFSLFF
jgi:transcription elongation factor